MPPPMQRLLAALAAASLLLASALASAESRGRDASDKEVTHVVAPGQTLARIAKRYRIPIQQLREHNSLPAGPLKPGTRLTIPARNQVKNDTDAPGDARAKSDPKKDRKDRDAKPAKTDRDEDRDDEEESPKKRKGKHKKAQDDADQEEEETKTATPGHVHLVHGDASWEGKVLLSRGGKIAPAASKAFARLLAPEKGHGHAIDRRLIALVVKVSDHFGGRPIQVVSGFRPGKAGSHSKHSAGAAIDFHIPGVRDTELRDFARSLDQVGVGYYPNSGFVHLDVRPSSFSWTDTSRPGETPRYTHDEPGAEEGEGKKKSDRGDKAKKADEKKASEKKSDEKKAEAKKADEKKADEKKSDEKKSDEKKKGDRAKKEAR
jgi:uncharacterized protein YcbK (DUF882 family)